MERSTNALAELAKEIRVMSLWVDSKYKNILSKAQRIVSELAKVYDRRDGETNSDVLWRCNDCIAKCRAIAEEGAKDEKCRCEICRKEYEPQQLHEGLCATCEWQMQEESWEVQDGK